MKTVQKRIGLLLSIFSAMIFISRVIAQIGLYESFEKILLTTAPILLIGAISLFTILRESLFCKIFQVSIFIIISIISFIDYYDSPHAFFFFVTGIILIFSYGWLYKNIILKSIIMAVGFYMFLVIFTFPNELDRWTNALNIVALIGLFLLILWVVAKNYIKKIETNTQEKIDKIETDILRYKKGIEKEEADFEDLYKDAVQTAKESLDLCKLLASRGDGNV